MSDAKYLGLTANRLAKIATNLERENAKLREELTAEHALAETLGHYHEIKQAENAKLRELVKLTYAFLAWADGATFSDGTPAVHASDRREVEDRMRELGVEVE